MPALRVGSIIVQIVIKACKPLIKRFDFGPAPATQQGKGLF
jgi:hypothetical protein